MNSPTTSTCVPFRCPAPLVVCERTGRWAAVLERCLAQFVGDRPGAASAGPVVSCRSTAECLERAVEFPEAFVVVEIGDEWVDAALELLYDLHVDFPGCCTAAVGERRSAAYEPLVRELGGLAMATDFVAARSLAATIDRRRRRIERRHGRELTKLGPQEWADQVMAALPWS